MREVWMPVFGYEDLYEASNHGDITRSNGQLLQPSFTDGYAHVSLSKDGVVATHRVHVLVLTAFCGPPPFAGAEAAHNDGVKANCRLTNLRWATTKENAADVGRHGRRPQGEAVYGAVLTEDQVRDIRRRILGGERNPPIARDFNVSVSTVHLIRHNRTWKHIKE